VAHGSSTLLACALACAGRAPFVYRVIGDPAYWYAPPLRRARVRPLLRRASRIVVLSERAKGWLDTELGLDGSRITVIPNAIDASHFPLVTPAARTEARGQLGIAADARLAVFIGSLSPEKGPEIAVRAVAQIEDMHLAVAGDGPDRSAVRDLATALLGDRAHLLGAVADTVPVLAAADVVLLPSLTEGMPAVAIEATMSGVPIVASDVGDTRDVLGAEAGVVVPRGDADAMADGVRKVLERRAESAGATPELRRWAVARFSLDAVAEQWLAVLREYP
jgi:glycosyltransferase involved in cell wall biosynthesis